ncbi:NnrS family protein, partial [Albidovulum sp.]|uniref:NnrS family protein n=1 Tax=Albidovulum sp. TaxID=1872424 RepID=UPI0025BBFC9B
MSPDGIAPRAALWRHPAGVFFALAAVFATALPWIWLLPLDDPRLAHVRLGIFGFGGAAVTGYVLTAQRAWTGRDAPLPAPLLGALALAARIAAFRWPEAALAPALPLALVAGAVLWPV